MSPTQSKATPKATPKANSRGKATAATATTHADEVQASSVVREDISDIEAPGTEGTLTKAELSALLVDQLGINRRNAKTMVDTFFELMSETLIRGEELKLSGFGNFQVRAKNERPGRNPRTGEPVAITPRHVVTFHASAILKDMAQHSTLVPPASHLPLESKRG